MALYNINGVAPEYCQLTLILELAADCKSLKYTFEYQTQ